MGRPSSTGGPAFRFTQNEVVEMEACLQEVNNSVPTRETISALANKFSASPERIGKSIVQPKQVWNWYQNRRHSQKAKVGKAQPVKLSVSAMLREDSTSSRNVALPISAPSGNPLDGCSLEFEAKSARDGAWYDVAAFLSVKNQESRDVEVRVRFTGFGVEEDEWVTVRTCVRQRSLPCENSECVAILAGDLILCFQEGKEQALYFDAHVLDAQRRRHDVRGCRCRFLVRYVHDQSEEIVALRKICRRPETNYRLQSLQASRAELKAIPTPTEPSFVNDFTAPPLQTRHRKQRKSMDVNTDEAILTAPNSSDQPNNSLQTLVPVETNSAASSDVIMEDALAAAATAPLG